MSSRKRKTKENFFADNYRICWKYLGESKNFIFIIIAIFFAFTILGFFVSPPENLVSQLMNYLNGIVGGLRGLSLAQLISFIFLNNAKTSFFGIFFGILLGIFPVFASAFNGYILGFVSRLSVNKDGFLVLWRLLPHGIFELPAVFISLGIGLKLGTVLVRNKDELKDNLYNALRVFISIVIPLLIVAAIIEGTLIYLFGK